MRTRMQFTKLGHVKFVGHLDTVRLFQRAIKVARIPIAYSQGFNPHSLVYFAMPLSVGVSSNSEYMDIVTKEDVSPEEMMAKLNQVLPRGIAILKAFEVDQKTPTLMSLVHEADYSITFDEKDVTEEVMQGIKDKLDAETILTMKKSKKGKMKEVDFKPLVRNYTLEKTAEGYALHLKVAAGSMENLSPELLLKAVTENECENWDYHIQREALYTATDEGIVALDVYR
ncbi:MAG: TIGR03936 family radical SAM-associated protein [Cellulosilyticaceae bacterium]